MEYEKRIPEDVLVDLCSRFVINVPVQEQSDLIRICFQVELAHWFYIDFYSKNFPQKRPCGLKEFTLQVFNHISFLQPFVNDIDKIIEEWKDYKFSVPTFGGIILDEDLSHVLLVQNYKSCWGFPKGKVNKEEPPHQCAIREVYEETGFDISNLIHPNEYIEATLNERVIRLYIIPGVSKDEKFIPRTRNEIKAVDWFPICDIPLNKKDAALKLKFGSGNTSNSVYSAFYMVSPFLRKLRQWIYDHSNYIVHRKRRQRHKSCSDIDKVSSYNLSDSVEMLRNYHYSEADENVKTDKPLQLSEMLESTIKDQKIDSKNMSRKLSDICITNKQFSDGKNQINQFHELSLTSRDFTCSANSSFANLTVCSELSSILKSEKEICQASSHFSGEPWSTSVDLSSRPMLSITSSDSAFRKVEKSTKVSRRKRKNKAITKDSISLTESFETTSCNKPTTIHKRIDCIPSLLNFQFDIGSILEAMNEAALKIE